MQFSKFILFFVLILGAVSCETEDVNPYSGLCDKPVIVDKDLYNQVNTQNYSIKSATINGDCLEVVISSGGCNGSTWEIELIDSEAIAESNPIQRYIRISLVNEEPCFAIVTKEISFDLTPLRTNDDKILLNLENWKDLLPYSYR